ncbi:MAG: hypothetical protein K0Q60_3385 [Microvirga sp.]|nr:hypothetical protein [Microvirga sp.]
MDRRIADAIFPGRPHIHGLGQDAGRALQLRHADPDRPQAPNLVLGRHGAALPRMGLALPVIIDEAQALAFEILEVEGKAAVTLDDPVAAHMKAIEAILPPSEGLLAVHAQRRLGDAVGATPLAIHRPVEECDVRAGRRLRIRVEQMVGAHIVLIDRLLHESQAQRLGVEGVIAARVRRDGGEMMNSSQLHDALHS